MFPGHYHCPLYYAFFLRFSFYFLWLLFLTFPFLSKSALIVICIPIAQQVRGEKIDDYVIYCDNWIFNCLFSIDDTTRCFHVSSPVRQRYYLAAIITYWKNSSYCSIIRGHLAHKSYYLCHAGTRTRRNVMEINFRRTSNCSKLSDIPLR